MNVAKDLLQVEDVTDIDEEPMAQLLRVLVCRYALVTEVTEGGPITIHGTLIHHPGEKLNFEVKDGRTYRFFSSEKVGEIAVNKDDGGGLFTRVFLD